VPVFFDCCVLSGRGLCDGRIICQECPECGVSECDHESLIIRVPWPNGGCCTMVKKSVQWYILTTVLRKCLGKYTVD
jgi:hypothetical protein